MSLSLPSVSVNNFFYGNAAATRLQVYVSTTAAGTLATSFANGQTVDGIVLATGNRILIKNQASGIENGVYTVNVAGAPTRTIDYAAGQTAGGTIIYVSRGTTNAGTIWFCTSQSDVIGTDSLTFTQTGNVTTTGTQTLSNKTLIANSTLIVDQSDPTKRLQFNTANSSGSTTLTLQTNSSTNQTLSAPNLTFDNSDTLIVSKVQQTQYRKVLAGGTDFPTPNLNTLLGQYALGGNCNHIAFNNSGTIAYIARGGGSFIEVRSTITALSLGSWSAPTGPYGVCVSGNGNYIVTACKSTNNIIVFDTDGNTIGTAGAMNSPQFPTPSFEVVPYIYVPSPNSHTVHIFENISFAPALHSVLNTSLATPLAVAVAYNTTEVYIANSGNNTVTWYNGAVYNTNPVTTFGGTINLGAPVTFVAAAHQSDVIYACTSTTFQYISTVSKTVTSSISVGSGNMYISLSTDNKYAYITGPTAIYMVVLATQVTSTIISLPVTPQDPISAVVTPDNNRLFICGSDPTNQVLYYNVQKTQYSAYAVGIASQTDLGEITGLRGVRWSDQLNGGVIVYSDGRTADITPNNDNNYALLYTNVSQTVTDLAYTIYYGASTVGPSGQSYISNNSVIVKPYIVDNADSSRKISFNFDDNVSNAELIIKNNITSAGQTYAYIPDIAATDTFTLANVTQTLTNKTLTTPTINNATIATPTITNPTITNGNSTSLSLTTPTISGATITTSSFSGTIDNSVIGGVTPAAGTFTTLTANTQLRSDVATNQIRTGTGANLTTSNYPASAGAVTLTFPNTTDTMVARDTTDTLTNKTMTAPFWTIQNSSPIATPAAANTVNVFAISYSSDNNGKTQLSQIVRGQNGPYYYEYQPFFGNKKIVMVTAPSDTTTAFNSFGMNMLAGAGTLGTIAPLSTSAATHTRRLTLTTTAGAVNTTAYLADTSGRKWIFPGTKNGGIGGFHMIVKFTMSDANSVSFIDRVFIGLSAALPTATVDPTASTNLIGLYKNGGDTTFGFMANGTTASSGLTSATTIGISTSAIYEFRMFQYPRANLCYFMLRQFNNTSSETIEVGQLTGTSGTLYPAATLSPMIWLNSAGETIARTISPISVYVETEN